MVLTLCMLSTAHSIDGGVPGINIEDIRQRLKEIDKEIEIINQSIKKRDKLVRIWVKSSKLIKYYHDELLKKIGQFNHILKKDCQQIKYSLYNLDYLKKPKDTEIEQAYQDCNNRLSKAYDSANKFFEAVIVFQKDVEELGKKSNLAKAVVTVNQKFKIVLEEEKLLLQSLKEDLNLFKEVKNIIKRE